jgi:hypothetical protein
MEGWKGGRSVPDRWNLSDQGFDLLAEARSADMNLGWSVGRRSDVETSNGRVRERRLLRFLLNKRRKRSVPDRPSFHPSTGLNLCA